ncbi:hypothetical protein CcCBS67573_g01385 [Chytriomyces confervae]|uniref:Uncharacterized protein n=1 Tax=Chytriomyces confervae TaxID=246404 RepID=A0A507FP33_9FUNG|nr:hypothetical protein HDU80_004396 [Chytriomyces hyalinus]TPX77345.1 hypothetical protein CcCBS67573_g01385 [Chytriomyces confervae]
MEPPIIAAPERYFPTGRVLPFPASLLRDDYRPDAYVDFDQIQSLQHSCATSKDALNEHYNTSHEPSVFSTPQPRSRGRSRIYSMMGIKMGFSSMSITGDAQSALDPISSLMDAVAAATEIAAAPVLPFRLPDLFANHMRRKRLLELEAKHPNRPHTRIVVADLSKSKHPVKEDVLLIELDDITAVAGPGEGKKTKPKNKRKQKGPSKLAGDRGSQSIRVPPNDASSGVKRQRAVQASRLHTSDSNSNVTEGKRAYFEGSSDLLSGAKTRVRSIIEQGKQTTNAQPTHSTRRPSGTKNRGSISIVVNSGLSASSDKSLPTLSLSNDNLPSTRFAPNQPTNSKFRQPSCMGERSPLSAAIPATSPSQKSYPKPYTQSIQTPFAYSTIPKATPPKRVRIAQHVPNPDTPYRKLQTAEIESLHSFLLEKGLKLSKELLARAFVIPQEILKPNINVGHMLKGYGFTRYVKPGEGSRLHSTDDSESEAEDYGHHVRNGKLSSRGKGILPVHKVAVLPKDYGTEDLEDVVPSEPRINTWWTAAEYKELRSGWEKRKVKKAAAMLELERKKQLVKEPFNSYVKGRPASPSKNTKKVVPPKMRHGANSVAVNPDAISVSWFPTESRNASRLVSRTTTPAPTSEVLHVQQSYTRYKPGVLS